MTKLEEYLSQFNEEAWLEALEGLLPEIHEVDRDAVQAWFRFYPLDLRRYIETGEDRDATLHGLAMQGNFDLAGQIDSSHHFLYGHRYWPTVKALMESQAAEFDENSENLVDIIRLIAVGSAEKLGVDRSQTYAIAAVALMTLNQVGIESFKAASGEVKKPLGLMKKSPEAIIAARNEDDSQGIFGFLKTVNKKFSIHYSSQRTSGRFEIVNEQEIASASGADRSRDWRQEDERCWEGVVPVECLSASCGTCWIGVTGGREKLSPVEPRERRAMSIFGYNQPGEERPFLRLACQAKAYGNASIVIPPWNAVFGKKVRGNVEDLELEPVTTSAKTLRTAVAGDK